MAVAAAVGFHLLLFLVVAYWRATPVPPLTSGFSVSLVDGPGRESFIQPGPTIQAPPMKPPPKPTVIQTKPEVVSPPETEPLKLRAAVRPDLSPLLLPDPAIMQISAPAQPPMSTDAAKSDAAPAGASIGGSKRCEIFDVIQHALQTSEGVRSAVAMIPAKARSVANAVMVWDGAWATAESMGGPPALEPIRAAVLDGVAQAPAACRDDAVRGPRLITVGDTHSTTVLAFGSGEWRWSDLTKTATNP